MHHPVDRKENWYKIHLHHHIHSKIPAIITSIPESLDNLYQGCKRDLGVRDRDLRLSTRDETLPKFFETETFRGRDIFSRPFNTNVSLITAIQMLCGSYIVIIEWLYFFLFLWPWMELPQPSWLTCCYKAYRGLYMNNNSQVAINGPPMQWGPQCHNKTCVNTCNNVRFAIDRNVLLEIYA